jgi:diguanylate cyclase (GGDEF)-like protein
MNPQFIQSRITQPGLLPGIVFLLALIFSIIAYTIADTHEQRRIENTFHELAHLKAQRVSLRVDGYERSLIDLRGFFIASNAVSETEFLDYLKGVQISQRYPALHEVGYGSVVTEKNRTAIKAELKKHGIASLPAAPYLLNIPLLYHYPTGNGAIGNQINADPRHNEAIRIASELDQVQITRLINLRFNNAKGHAGFVMYLPFYGNGAALITAEERRQALMGIFYVAFSVHNLIQTTIGEDVGHQFDVALFDGDTINQKNLVYDSGNVLSRYMESRHDSYTSTQRTEVAGRSWTFLFVAKPAFIKANQSDLPISILTGGIFISVLLAWLANTLKRRLIAEKRNEYLAYYDELTGLPNLANLRSILIHKIAQAEKQRKPFALFIIELIRFKEINYTMGQRVGDELLKQVGTRLQCTVGSAATVARISNLQFGVLLSEENPFSAIHIAQRMIKSLEEPLPARGINYELGAEAGITFFPGQGTDADVLLRLADIALLQARNAGRSYAIYNTEKDLYKPQRLALLSDFRNAVKEKQLQLYCQPKVDLRANKITSVEALVRWQHPNLGLIMPDQFIHLIEPTELIQPLSEHMIEAAIQQCYRWREKGLALPIAVNLSMRNLLNPELPEIIDRVMKTWAAEMTCISFEITESSIMVDPSVAIRVLHRLHAMGIQLHVDDFGTGYSSLSYLMKLPVDTIKIDHSFTLRMMEDQGAATIVKSTIEMAHSLQLKVVAEGTATRNILEKLKYLGCDEAQGNYISPPLPADEVLPWLQQSGWEYAISP